MKYDIDLQILAWKIKGAGGIDVEVIPPRSLIIKTWYILFGLLVATVGGKILWV